MPFKRFGINAAKSLNEFRSTVTETIRLSSIIRIDGPIALETYNSGIYRRSLLCVGCMCAAH